MSNIAEKLKTARNLIQMAVVALESTDEGTEWESKIAEFAEKASDLGFEMDDTAYKIEKEVSA